MEAFVGQIMMVGFDYAPRGWLVCNGQILPISQYQALFALLGVRYGGDGRTTFALPNLNGRTAIGTGQLAGGANYTLGAAGGAESVVLSAAQLPTHSHTATFDATGSGFKVASDQATLPGADGAAGLGRSTDIAPNPTSKPAIYAAAKSTLDTPLPGLTVAGAVTVAPTGGSAPVPVRDPYLALTAIICISGIYPPRP